ncbi:MAG: DNA replication/repair protein RecF [Microscillaceae bacterium]|nr:DNA replication/repair protein RecF [Microscillaceae bacterium]MDW8460042.1 DNA replication/repair protein RecF [Cytophagales bacterium]
MYLQTIQLVNFKNYEELALNFSPQINTFLGENGSGKTNLLDAIHYLALTKSAFNSIDSQNIRYQEEWAIIQGNFQIEGQVHNVSCSLRVGQKKIFSFDKKPYSKIADHIGKIPIVLIAPQDSQLIDEGSETRRSFLDSMICQFNLKYLYDLMQYNHLLKQRNSLLKQFAEQNKIDKDLIEVYDTQLLPLNYTLWHTRQQFMQQFQPIFQENYKIISQQKEQTQLVYQSQLNELNFEQNFRNSLDKDILLQRTSYGIHKDDLDFLIQTYPLKKNASQGQQKSFLIALKIAQFEILRQQTTQKPLLLLDDIFDKLDENRIKTLLTLIAKQNFGQIFLADARPERSSTLLKNIQVERKNFFIQKGKVQSEALEYQC